MGGGLDKLCTRPGALEACTGTADKGGNPPHPSHPHPGQDTDAYRPDATEASGR